MVSHIHHPLESSGERHLIRPFFGAQHLLLSGNLKTGPYPSLTESLPERINEKRSQKSTRGAVELTTAAIPAAGANDAVLPSYASERTRGVPLDRYMANLDHFVASLVDAGSNNRCLPGAQILLITSPPFLSSTRVNAPGRPATLDLEHTRRYKDACKTVGKVWKKKASGREQTLDAWKALVDAAGDESQESLRPFYVYDGVHLSTKGYQVLYNEFLRIIESDWPHLDPTRKI
ncbi:hypothetical protein QFC21_005393 [Naganishia friedmannii]|uniref:Uncharacterized protein n=1 Tax=Naganishia friedmannii TaxID=89922 RepID=A0ACC2VAL2_9TREE|nr:hypothetical protein QFC21_005393 [Naganishia friedmannii]